MSYFLISQSQNSNMRVTWVCGIKAEMVMVCGHFKVKHKAREVD